MTIQPLETKYKGYRFRSRTEARWAVFFDSLGIKYEYEKEGYKLKSGCYLPDFWLPDYKYWIEIKGIEPTKEELSKMEELRETTEFPAILFFGYPEVNKTGFIFCCEIGDSGGGDYFGKDAVFGECMLCYKVDIKLIKLQREILTLNFQSTGICHCNVNCLYCESPRIREAVEKSKEERFYQ